MNMFRYPTKSLTRLWCIFCHFFQIFNIVYKNRLIRTQNSNHAPFLHVGNSHKAPPSSRMWWVLNSKHFQPLPLPYSYTPNIPESLASEAGTEKRVLFVLTKQNRYAFCSDQFEIGYRYRKGHIFVSSPK